MVPALIAGVVTPLHKELMERITSAVDSYDAALAIRLNGGTALAAFYLGHRESEDLDFFVGPAANCRAVGEDLIRVLAPAKITAQTLRQSPGMFEAVVARGRASIRLQIVAQSPFLLEPPSMVEGVRVTAWRDVVAGKLHAIADRTEPRDFVDLHCILDAVGGLTGPDALSAHLHAMLDDLRAHDPGLTAAAMGRSLAAGGEEELYRDFPLRVLRPAPPAAVAATARHCAAVLAADVLREASRHS